jgi:hypothetical protein
MSTKINVRSPYYTKIGLSSTQYVTVRLYVWEGLSGDTTTAIYTFTKTPVGGNSFVVFEFAEYIRDYLVTEYGDYSTRTVWFKWDYQKYDADGTPSGSLVTATSRLAVDGYRYFEDGIQTNELSKQLLQSNTIIYYNEGEDIVFPIWAEDLSIITLTTAAGADVQWSVVEDFWDVYDVSWGYALTPIEIYDTGYSQQKIQYVRLSISEALKSGDTITITSQVNSVVTVITLEEICEPKYTPLNVIFYNKFGALQNIWFFKKSVTTLGTTSEAYKANIMDFDPGISYNTSSHQYKTFNVQGRENIRCSTGFIDEQYNEVIRQMMLSEQVWIDNGTDVLPVAVSSNSLQFKKGVNDKLIDYTIEFQYAFDKINNIR